MSFPLELLGYVASFLTSDESDFPDMIPETYQFKTKYIQFHSVRNCYYPINGLYNGLYCYHKNVTYRVLHMTNGRIIDDILVTPYKYGYCSKRIILEFYGSLFDERIKIFEFEYRYDTDRIFIRGKYSFVNSCGKIINDTDLIYSDGEIHSNNIYKIPPTTFLIDSLRIHLESFRDLALNIFQETFPLDNGR